MKLFFNTYYKYILLFFFVCVWLWSAWYPASEKNWFLENKTVFLSVPVVYFFCVWYIQFSKLSLTLITIFIMLHLVGSHYNYGSVPFGKTIGDIFNVNDNMYDKFVHFSFGLLIVYPLREFFLRVAQIKGFWGYLVPFMAVLTLGVFYEIFEWVTVLKYDAAIGYLFIGGNDPFDTTKDLLSAGLGALLTLSTLALFAYTRSRHRFRKGMGKSFIRDNATFPKEDIFLHENIEKEN
ncbi:MAG: DUF2238 domain-containing protein [Candidatus Paceibacterota bacterium]